MNRNIEMVFDEDGTLRAIKGVTTKRELKADFCDLKAFLGAE